MTASRARVTRRFVTAGLCAPVRAERMAIQQPAKTARTSRTTLEISGMTST
jgi:hypothetical protein